MARTSNLTDFLTDVATAIKQKKGSQADIFASDFDTEILALPTGQGTYQQKAITVYDNGTQVITPDIGYDAIDELTITTQVPEKQLQTKNYTFTQNANLELEPDNGYDGFRKVNVIINVDVTSAIAPYSDNIKTNKEIYGVRGTYTSEELATKLINSMNSSHDVYLQLGIENIGTLPFDVTVSSLPSFTASDIVALLANSVDGGDHVAYLSMQDDAISLVYMDMTNDTGLTIFFSTNQTTIDEMAAEGLTVGKWHTIDSSGNYTMCTQAQFDTAKVDLINLMSDIDVINFDNAYTILDLTALLQYVRDKLNIIFSDAQEISL